MQLCLVSLTVLCVFFQTAGGKQEAKESSIVVVLPLVVFVLLDITEVIVCMVSLPHFRNKASRLRR